MNSTIINKKINTCISSSNRENKEEKIKKGDSKDSKIRNRGSNGSKCSKNGILYELMVFNVVRQLKCIKTNIDFNTQTEKELGGCKAGYDLICNFYKNQDINIEIKKMKTPDWMQCSLKYDSEKNIWKPSNNNKISNESKQIFEKLLNDNKKILFNGKIPPFFTKQLTHEEWLKIKSDTKDFNDHYLNCPDDTISKLYNAKGCQYIQISNKGLYHLNKDICCFDVPFFTCPQKLRIRTKIHKRKDKNGYCKLSVTLSCMPKNIKELKKSNYSIDNIEKIPKVLIKKIKFIYS
jgi:hypothetical protein